MRATHSWEGPVRLLSPTRSIFLLHHSFFTLSSFPRLKHHPNKSNYSSKGTSHPRMPSAPPPAISVNQFTHGPQPNRSTPKTFAPSAPHSPYPAATRIAMIATIWEIVLCLP